MLTPELIKTLEKKWDNCWPVSDLRPFALLDLISYIFFIKKLDDWELIHPKVKSSGFDNFIYTNEIEEFTWSKLQKMDAKEIQQLFNKDHGVIDLMKNYSSLNSLYSDYFKAPLLIAPTAKLIFNAVEIINIIETSDEINQAAIIEFLFNKLKRTSQNKQEFVPEPISKLMASLAAPTVKDTILDPCAGNGSLLINSKKYIEKQAYSEKQQSTIKLLETNLIGIESDLVLLRMAAMNMSLHGIKNPNIHTEPTQNDDFKNNYSLILSALMHSQNQNNQLNQNETNNLERENLLLTGILENLNEDGRAVILVPQDLLKSDNPLIIKNRKNLVGHFNLEAVITLGQQSDSIFSGAGILIFNKSAVKTTENVWFCKWGIEKKKNRRNVEGNNNYEENENEEFSEVTEILDKWRNRKEFKKEPSRNSFYISAKYFKNNNYKLSFNDYKLIRQDVETDKETENDAPVEIETIITAKNENLVEFFEGSPQLPEMKKKSRTAPILITLIILILGGGALYWLYLKGNFNNLFSKDTITSSASKIPTSTDSGRPNGDTSKINNSDLANDAKRDSASELSTKYKVVKKAWFYYEPNPDRIKPLYIPEGKNVILRPTEEENGFVYVVYKNSRGEETHGWLNKKDLRPVE